MNNLFDFFQKLAKEKWSGELQVTASEGNAFIVLREGEFFYAYRPLDRAIERLRQMEWVRVPPDQVLKGLQQWEPLLFLLLQENEAQQDRLIRHLKTDCFEIFFRIFFWKNVDLIPLPENEPQAADPRLDFYRRKSLSKLLKEAQTRLQEWPKLQAKIQSSHRVFVSQIPAAELPADGNQKKDAVDQALEMFEEAGNLNVIRGVSYTEDQIELLRLCDGRNNVGDLIRLSHVGEFLTLRRLYDLWDQGAVVPRDSEGTKSFKKKRWHLSRRDCVALFALGAGLLVSLALPQFVVPPSKQEARVSWQISSALEIYRGLEGRYPVTLAELSQRGILQGQSLDEIEYRLVTLDRYEIRPKTAARLNGK